MCLTKIKMAVKSNGTMEWDWGEGDDWEAGGGRGRGSFTTTSRVGGGERVGKWFRFASCKAGWLEVSLRCTPGEYGPEWLRPWRGSVAGVGWSPQAVEEHISMAREGAWHKTCMGLLGGPEGGWLCCGAWRPQCSLLFTYSWPGATRTFYS